MIHHIFNLFFYRDHVPVFHPLIERSPLLIGQIIQGDMVHRKRERLFQVPHKIFNTLPRGPKDQIHTHLPKPDLEYPLQGP